MHSSNDLLIFDPISKSFRIVKTGGDVPPRTLAPSGTVFNHNFYIFGGQHGDETEDIDEGNNNRIYKLNLVTFQWTQISPKSYEILPLPCEKSLMAAYDKYLYVFGGYGDPPKSFKNYPIQPKFHSDQSSHYEWPRGWIGNLNRFDFKTLKWEFLKSGPSPRAGHTGDVWNNLWIIFGGCGSSGRLNDVHAFDFQTLTWHCLDQGFRPPLQYYLDHDHPGSVINDNGVYYPEPRSVPSFNLIQKNDEMAKFFMYGGIGMLNTPLNDAWILEVHPDLSISWNPYPLPYDHGPIRAWHGSCYVEPQLIIHSGKWSKSFSKAKSAKYDSTRHDPS